MTLPFSLPPLTAEGDIPFWDGNGFRIGDQFTQVLQYSMNHLGWNDDLTFFHEESAGDHHFIDRASRTHAIQQLKKNLTTANPIILEIGCSSGFMLERLNHSFPTATVIGSDVVSEPLKKLSEKMPKTPLFRFDLTQCPLPDQSVDAIVILNVLEHIENDREAIKQLYRILKPGGIAIIEVPAGPHLFDIYDQKLMHFRRYKLKNLTTLLEQHFFKISKKSHLGFFIYPGFWLVKQRNKRFKTKSIETQQKIISNNIKSTGQNKLLHFIMQSELFFGKFVSYPFGIRCLATCIKEKS